MEKRRWPILLSLLSVASVPWLMGVEQCGSPDNDGDGYTVQEGDCDDAQAAVYPDAPETCDALDNNCNGLMDDQDPAIQGDLLWYQDADADGFGLSDVTLQQCLPPAGYTSVAGDCNDQSSTTFPGATEVCDGMDNDCDASIDESVLTTFYPDLDGDGYGVDSGALEVCSAPAGYAPSSGDCDDANDALNPGENEVLNGADDNCDGQADEGIQVTGMAAGGYHSLAVASEGTVLGWGWNHVGQLGTGTRNSANTAVAIPGVSHAIAVSAGFYHSLALLEDRTVLGWGFNSYYQVGSSQVLYSLTPLPQAGLQDIVAISAGAEHSLALDANGMVWGWGCNLYGQLGDSTLASRPTPKAIEGLPRVVEIAAGAYHSFALDENGQVWVWGDNTYGQLGVGPTSPLSTPAPLSSLQGVTSLASGYFHGMALRLDSAGETQLWTWGSNYTGELGDGTGIDSFYPVQVTGLTGVSVIAGASSHSMALLEDGTAWTWGDNSSGQLGDGTYDGHLTPVQVLNLTGATGIWGGGFHTLALATDGAGWAWGDNYFWQLGDGVEDEYSVPQPVAIVGLP